MSSIDLNKKECKQWEKNKKNIDEAGKVENPRTGKGVKVDKITYKNR